MHADPAFLSAAAAALLRCTLHRGEYVRKCCTRFAQYLLSSRCLPLRKHLIIARSAFAWSSAADWELIAESSSHSSSGRPPSRTIASCLFWSSVHCAICPASDPAQAPAAPCACFAIEQVAHRQGGSSRAETPHSSWHLGQEAQADKHSLLGESLRASTDAVVSLTVLQRALAAALA